MNFSELKHDPERKLFTLEVDGHTAQINYSERDGKTYLIHSEVPYHLRGKGVGKILTEKTFEYLEAEGKTIVPVCSYIKLIAQRTQGKFQNIEL